MSNIEIEASIKAVRELLGQEKGLSPAFRAAMNVMFMAVSILLDRVNLNSSKPPSSDPNRKRKSKARGLNPGGQKDHAGTTLKQVDDVDIRRVVTEYRAEVLKDANGKRYVATFPVGVTRPVQYGNTIKAHAVYLFCFQLLPYKRIEDYFCDQLQIPISAGTIYNFNKDAFLCVQIL